MMAWPEYDHGLPHHSSLLFAKCWLPRYQPDREFAVISWIYFSWSTNKQMVWTRILSNKGLISFGTPCETRINLVHQTSGLEGKSPASECLWPSSGECCWMKLQFLGTFNPVGHIDIPETLRFRLLWVSRWSSPRGGRPEVPSYPQLW